MLCLLAIPQREEVNIAVREEMGEVAIVHCSITTCCLPTSSTSLRASAGVMYSGSSDIAADMGTARGIIIHHKQYGWLPYLV